MFIGEYTYSIDDKKRISLPPKFRKLLGKTAVVTKGLDQCLFLYPAKEWEKMAERLSKLPVTQADARGFARLMLAGAMEVNIDALGRILLPDYLKQYASLTRRIVVTGMYNRVEVWDEKSWGSYKLKAEKESGDMAEGLKELGL